MALTQNNTHVTDATDRLPSRLRGFDNWTDLIELLAAPAQVLEDVFWDLYVNRRIDSAAGVQLEQLGTIVGEPRRLISTADDDYRRLIRARIAANRSRGIVYDLINTITAVLGSATPIVKVEQYFPAAVRLLVMDTAVPAVASTLCAEFLRDAAAAGVKTEFVSSVSAPKDTFTHPVVDTLVDTTVSAAATSIELDQGNIDQDSGAALPYAGGRLMIASGRHTQEIVTYTARTGAGPTTFSGIVNELGESGFRFAHTAGELAQSVPPLDWAVTQRQSVTWRNLTNTTADGDDLENTGGAGGAWDAFGASTEAIAINVDGAVEFKQDTPGDDVIVGFTSSESVTAFADIDYGLWLLAADVRVYHAGSLIYTHTAAPATGDVYRVQRAGDVVSYWKNGARIYYEDIGSALTGKVYAGAAFFDAGAKITDVKIESHTAQVYDQNYAGKRHLVQWQDTSAGVTLAVNNITRTAAGAGWTEGGRSTQEIAGDCALEFQVLNPAADNLMVGLADTDITISYTDIDYAVQNHVGTPAYRVYELGVLRHTELVTPTAGDVLRIMRIGTEVTYWLNNRLFYTSGVVDAGNDMFASAAINGSGGVPAGVTNVLLYAFSNTAGGGDYASTKSGD